ncbi:facilitated trehalose transporter Tret1-like [Drosophila innubila]|uniref:facilitated trehalose transporter Tret1-like n=1 Tax=Drosophila innubila TaxID=198719 RepID=UPI00148CBBD7|nr:facilitated trehalose transporter Tret1-like [Drosophila innubila]
MSSFWDRPGGQNQHVAGFCASLGALSLGASVGWSAPAQYHINNKEDAYGFAVNLDEFGWICSLLWLGCSCVIIPIGLLADYFGRKMTMLVVVLPYLAAWILIIFAPNPSMLMVARFFLGVSGGSYIITVPLYCTEIAQLEMKNTLLSFYSIFFVLGILYAYIAGAFNSLKCLNCACAILPLIFLGTFIWMPESPVYYLLWDQELEAEESLEWLRQQNVSMELFNMQLQIEQLQEEHVPFWTAIRQKSTLRALMISIGLMFFKNFSGGTAIITYCTTIHRQAGVNIGFQPDMSTILVGIFFVVFSIACVLSLNCARRRPMLIFTIFLDVLSNALLALYFHLVHRKESYLDNLNWMPLFSLCSFISFYALGIGTLTYVIIFELFSVGFRSLGTGIVCSLFALFAFFNTIIFPVIVRIWGDEDFFWISMAFSFLAWVFVYFLVPETKGQTPDEIQDMLKSTQCCVATNSNK